MTGDDQSTLDEKRSAERPVSTEAWNSVTEVDGRPPRDTVLPDPGDASRYVEGPLIGQGGMGEVVGLKDLVIGREVACKSLKVKTASQHRSVERFLREARVQGQLEHPAVVPVYDLGKRPDGRHYFTMKRVRGRSLESVIADPSARAEARYSRRRLLTAFAQVALAIDFVHSRGVLHRDLKPANIMLGEFGEVHVLDWGLAKIKGTPDLPRIGLSADADEEMTQVGSVLGTPGYMSPEQARAENDRLGSGSDVYSLGAILFELLEGRRLHPGSTHAERLASTVSGPELRFSEGTPPELRSIVERAIAIEPSERTASARTLADDVFAYLDGARDEERRAVLVRGHLDRSSSLLRGRTVEGRTQALRELGKAIALDPMNQDALAGLDRLLSTLPDEPPPAARAGLLARRAELRAGVLRAALARYAIWLCLIPVVLMFGVRSELLVAITTALLGLTFALGLTMYVRRWLSDTAGLVLVATSTCAIASVAGFLGPFVLVPTIAATNALLFATLTGPNGRRIILTISALAVLVPVSLASGFSAVSGTAAMHTFAESAMTIHSPMSMLPAEGTFAFLVVASIALIVTPSMLVGRLNDRLQLAEERLYLQAYYLRELIPRGQ